MFHAEGNGKLFNRSLMSSRHWQWFVRANPAIVAGNVFICSVGSKFARKLIVWVHKSGHLFCTSPSEFVPHKFAPNSLKAQRNSQSKLSKLGWIFIKARLIHRSQPLTIIIKSSVESSAVPWKHSVCSSKHVAGQAASQAHLRDCLVKDKPDLTLC